MRKHNLLWSIRILPSGCPHTEMFSFKILKIVAVYLDRKSHSLPSQYPVALEMLSDIDIMDP
jgi:hypothetical protein